jgi:hypothetical protein
VSITGQEKLLDAAHYHFKIAYREKGLTNIIDQASITGLYPRIISDSES